MALQQMVGKKLASNTGATEIMCKSLFKTIKKEADVEEKRKKGHYAYMCAY